MSPYVVGDGFLLEGTCSVALSSATYVKQTVSDDTEYPFSLNPNSNPSFPQTEASGHDQQYFSNKLLGLHTNCSHLILSNVCGAVRVCQNAAAHIGLCCRRWMFVRGKLCSHIILSLKYGTGSVSGHKGLGVTLP